MDKSRAVSTPAFVSSGPSSTAATAAAAALPERKLAPLGSVQQLFGIGETTRIRLAASGLVAIADLLAWFPRRYCELVELNAPTPVAVGQMVRLHGTVQSVRRAWLPGRRAMVTIEFAAGDGTPFSAAFFNQPWLAKAYVAGSERVLEGVLEQKGKRFSIRQPRVLAPGPALQGAVQLRYRDIEGVTSKRLQGWLAEALEHTDWEALSLPPLPRGLHQHDASVRDMFFAMHRPQTVAEHERARTHFAVREAVALFSKVAAARARRQGRAAAAFVVDDAVAARIRARLPFALTEDQDAAVRSVWRRLAGPAPMGVLLQGDVGTGKTAVAVAAAMAVVARGAQVAFLAPTELLAEQHCRLVSGWLEGSGVDVQLLTGSLDARTRKVLAATMQQKGPRIWFGTHALLSADANFVRLGLVIVDEQHRFGVEQRMQLVGKGKDPHVLVMTATPIPRTLALAMFGDLDLMTLRHRPGGRSLPRAVHQDTARWPRVQRSIARAVRRGGRVYVVCPTVGEDGEKGGAVLLHQVLKRDFRCRLVHGRMDRKEQQDAVSAFRRGDCDVLVGTTVLEVGVDVPAATLMVIVQADRFGLATLHQLRGRVGRSARRGLCIACGPKCERTDALCTTTDGFELAEIDLRLRGSGELLGTQQSGFSDLRALDPVEDFELLRTVRAAVSPEES